MVRCKWVMMFPMAVVLMLGLTTGTMGSATGVGNWSPSYKWPQLPELDIRPPSALPKVPGDTFQSPVAVGERDMVEATGRGRDLARGKVHDLRWQSTRVLAPWRVLVDRDGEYATLLSPPSVGSLLGYYAEQRSWPENVLQREVEDAVSRFGRGICIYVELRSYAHENTAFGSAGSVRPGTPGEVFEALFLLSDGGRKFEGMTSSPPGSTITRTHVGAAAELTAVNRKNKHGLWYQRVDFSGMTSYTRTHGYTSGQSYGANYYVWFPLVDEDGAPCYGTSPGSLTLTILTPNRQREVSFTKMR